MRHTHTHHKCKSKHSRMLFTGAFVERWPVCCLLFVYLQAVVLHCQIMQKESQFPINLLFAEATELKISKLTCFDSIQVRTSSGFVWKHHISDCDVQEFQSYGTWQCFSWRWCAAFFTPLRTSYTAGNCINVVGRSPEHQNPCWVNYGLAFPEWWYLSSCRAGET